MSAATTIARWLGVAPPSPPRQMIAPTVSNQIEYADVPSSDAVRMGQIFALQTDAGVVVTEQTAMRVSAAYACTRLIAGAIAFMKLPIYKWTKDRAGRERQAHDYWWLLNEQPIRDFGAATFWEFVVASMLLRGDAYAYLVRDRNGKVTEILPLRWEQVIPRRRPRDEGGGLAYSISLDGKVWGCDQDDMLHIPGFGFGLGWNGVCGLSVIAWAARQSIGIALQADRFAGQFYGSGAHPQHAITAAGKMTKEQKQDLKDAWVDTYGGTGINGIPLVLTEGLTVKDVSLNATDAQFLESRKFQVVDIARAFGVPPHMIGDTEKTSSWGSGIESLSLAFVQYTLGPHLKRIENELTRKLFRVGMQFVEFDVSSLLRGDLKTRGEYWRQALGGSQGPGWLTADEIRAHDDMPAKGGAAGDLYDPNKGNSTNAQPNPQPAAA